MTKLVPPVTRARSSYNLELKLVADAVLYITKSEYPSDSTRNEKRSIRRKEEKLLVRDGEIFYRKRGGREVAIASYFWLVLKLLLLKYYVVDSNEKKRILASCHSHPSSGHFGIRKTIDRISERFMWLGITKDVTEMVGD